MTDTVDMPVPFSGTQDQRIANRKTHYWREDYGAEVLCFNCEAKPWHVAAEYPCGTSPPRQQIPRSEIKDLRDVQTGWATFVADVAAEAGMTESDIPPILRRSRSDEDGRSMFRRSRSDEGPEGRGAQHD